MSDLLPCPFCGSEASHNGGGSSVFGRFWWTVGCKTCDVWLSDKEVWSQTDHGMLDPAYPPKHCFAAWNFRALPAVQPDASAIREAALRETLVALRGAGSFGRTAAEKHSALEQYCMCRDAILALPAVQPAHVNETPKSEHDERDVLTPDAKGGA